MQPNVLSIIIISHQHGPYLERCISAVFSARPTCPFEVVLIDNVGQDEGVSQIATSYPEVRVIRNKHPYGFSQNSNLGIQQTSGQYVLLLNPDTAVEPGALDELVIFMNQHPDAGACAARLMFPDGTLQHSCRRFPTIRSALVRRTPLRRWLLAGSTNQHHLMSDMDHTKTQVIDWALGACLMLRRATLDAVGLLDERFPLYCEDIDICYRIAMQGQSVYYVASAVVMHHHLAVSDKQFLTRRTWWHVRGMAWFVLKHYILGWRERRQLHLR